MKKKILTVLVAVITVVVCVLGIVACKDDRGTNSNFREGTYVYWRSPVNSDYSAVFKDGMVRSEGGIIPYKVDGDKVILMYGNGEDMVLEIVSDGVLKIPNAGGSVHAFFVIEGKTPPSDESEWRA